MFASNTIPFDHFVDVLAPSFKAYRKSYWLRRNNTPFQDRMQE